MGGRKAVDGGERRWTAVMMDRRAEERKRDELKAMADWGNGKLARILKQGYNGKCEVCFFL